MLDLGDLLMDVCPFHLPHGILAMIIDAQLYCYACVIVYTYCNNLNIASTLYDSSI